MLPVIYSAGNALRVGGPRSQKCVNCKVKVASAKDYCVMSNLKDEALIS
jgi:hypothetical protein